MKTDWERLRLNDPDDGPVWELFHENSKTTRFDRLPPAEAVLKGMQDMHESLPFEAFPSFPLPLEPIRLVDSLDSTLIRRASGRDIVRQPVSISEVHALVHYAYGITRANAGTEYPRPFRVVPSGGALYPLELFLHCSDVKELSPGLYHYNPGRNDLCKLKTGDFTRTLSDALVQPDVAIRHSVMIFITAMFERSTFKYGERGYRFALIEAGHVAQNISLVSTALGLSCLHVGGFFDSAIDDFLSLDGLLHSTIYIAAVGR